MDDCEDELTLNQFHNQDLQSAFQNCQADEQQGVLLLDDEGQTAPAAEFHDTRLGLMPSSRAIRGQLTSSNIGGNGNSGSAGGASRISGLCQAQEGHMDIIVSNDTDTIVNKF